MKNNLTNEFGTLSEFLSAFAPEVSGRSSEAISPALHKQLENLAAGKLGEEETRGISKEVLANENAMIALAELLNKDA